MKPNIQLPDYDRSILSISSSIMKHYNIKSNYKSLPELDNILKKDYKNIVYLILDCLGDNILTENMSDDSILKSNKITTVTSVFPPTTTAATTAIHSGLSPLESGWIGWMPYFKEYNKAIVLFTGKDYYTDELVMEKPENNILKYESIYEKISKKNKNIKYHQCFPSFAENGSNTFEELCKKIKECCNNNDLNIISAYWDDPDHTIHHTGTNSKEVKEVLNNIDTNLKKLSRELDDTQIIITADHGAINLKEIYINEIEEINDCLSFPPTIESRFVNFFIKENMKEQFLKSLEKHFKNKYILYTKEELLNSGLLGRNKPHKRINDYFGDYIVIMNADLSIRYDLNNNKKIHLADHSGITKEEMIVPVIAIECKKKVKCR